MLPRLKKIWADSAYRGQELAQWCLVQSSWDLEVVERTQGTRGFSVLPRRWVVERTFAWIGRHRRMSKDYEYLTSSSENMIYLTMIRLMVRRLARAAAAAREHTRYAQAA